MKKSYVGMRIMKVKRELCKEEGSVLIIALLVLAFFTLLGMSTFSISNMEIRIIGNENTQKQNLYCAEAAAMCCSQDMQDKDLSTESLSYLNGINSVTDTQSDIISLENKYILSDTVTELPATTTYASVSRGIASGSSLDMTKTRVHEYSVYGWCDRNNNLVIVEVGFRKAFK
jgi:Tfp pilus assembly protein PilX